MKKQTKLIIGLALAIISLCFSILRITNVIPTSPKKPKYIFYFIGDGMGLNHILGTEQYNAEKSGKGGIELLNFSKFPIRNFVTNHSASTLVSDSAAAGTALATGCKTTNTYIGIDSENRKLRSLTDVASDEGYMVGLVTNVGINHATPSSFYGHTSDRFAFPKLIDDYINSDVAFIAGATLIDAKRVKSATNTKIISTAELAERVRNAGIHLTSNAEEAGNIVGNRVALVEYDKKNKTLPYVLDRKGGEPSLIDYTKAAINYLSNNTKDGFFLMVEGGKLDYASHEQDAVASFLEVNEFAATIDLALAFAKQHPKETLIVVTSDHETGGMSLGYDNYEVRMNMLMGQKASSIELTRIVQDMRAEGKRDWNEYKQVLNDYLGLWSLVPVSKEEEALLKRDFYDIFLKYGPMVSGLYNNSEVLVYDAVRILNRAASIEWTSMLHTGLYTPIFAIGIGEREFIDCRDQTDIPKVLADLMGGEL